MIRPIDVNIMSDADKARLAAIEVAIDAALRAHRGRIEVRASECRSRLTP
jgi:hypothetical protein